MRKLKKRSTLLLIVGLMMITAAGMFLSEQPIAHTGLVTDPVPSKHPHVALTAELVQDKILKGSDGIVHLALDLASTETAPPAEKISPAVDLVVVMDRSGSMQGRKIADAKQAVTSLLAELSAKDRFALITYANRVHRHTRLLPLTADNRRLLKTETQRIEAGGGTNLGAGLARGMELLQNAGNAQRSRRVILISDGRANHGITKPHALARMAASAVPAEFAVSTVGVGTDFNEALMTAIADHGAGRYYYLEEPHQFSAAFKQEHQLIQQTAAESMEIRVNLPPQAILKAAGGYPIHMEGNQAVFRPGSLRYQQNRRLHLTFEFPTDKTTEFDIQDIEMTYRSGDARRTVRLPEKFTIACVEDQKDVFASIRAKAWSDKVVREDMNHLREKVAQDIQAGAPRKARARIQKYYLEKKQINQTVGSAQVADSLENEVLQLEKQVDDTFNGNPEEVRQKQKKTAKALQFKGYQGRRDIQ